MSIDDHTGFHFLPPSIHLPPELQPVHSVVMPDLSIVSTVTSVVVPHDATANHYLTLVFNQT